MTGYLLDTHAYLWALMEPERLHPQAYRMIHSDTHDLFFSIASLWEVCIKHGKGLLSLPEPPREYFPTKLQQNRVSLLEIKPSHVYESGTLTRYQGDPFDRMLIAQAMVEGLTVITSDMSFKHYGVRVIKAS